MMMSLAAIQSREENIPAESCYTDLAQRPIDLSGNGRRCERNAKTALDQTVVRETD